LALIVAVIASCSSSSPTSSGGGGGGGGGCTGTSGDIAVCDNHYNPATVSVPAGTTVNWTWKGTTGHSVTFTSGITHDSGVKTTGGDSQLFSAAGTYTYECTVHGAAMSGTINVTP
jgi:plastocyanin